MFERTRKLTFVYVEYIRGYLLWRHEHRTAMNVSPATTMSAFGVRFTTLFLLLCID